MPLKTIFCLCNGDKYGNEYVTRLQAMVKRTNPETSFVCFTDRYIDGVDCRALPCDHEGWWGKVGLFRPDLPIEYPALYLDLDVLVLSDLNAFVSDFDFMTIKQTKDVVSEGTIKAYNTSVMYFKNNNLTRPWLDFTEEVMQDLRGDQDWLAKRYPSLPTFDGDLIANLKDHKEAQPENAVIVLCNDIKNHEAVKDIPWVADIWKD